MQLKWVQMMGKKSEHKARDLKMPHLQKLKRDILTRSVLIHYSGHFTFLESMVIRDICIYLNSDMRENAKR